MSQEGPGYAAAATSPRITVHSSSKGHFHSGSMCISSQLRALFHVFHSWQDKGKGTLESVLPAISSPSQK